MVIFLLRAVMTGPGSKFLRSANDIRRVCGIVWPNSCYCTCAHITTLHNNHRRRRSSLVAICEIIHSVHHAVLLWMWFSLSLNLWWFACRYTLVALVPELVGRSSAWAMLTIADRVDPTAVQNPDCRCASRMCDTNVDGGTRVCNNWEKVKIKQSRPRWVRWLLV